MPFIHNLHRAPSISLHLFFFLFFCFFSQPISANMANFTLSDSQAVEAEINSTAADTIAAALRFEQSNYANGFVASDDEFYQVPRNASSNVANPGTLLKVQSDIDTSAYTLPPETALSRILFQSKTLNGIAVPASAYVLWPSCPRSQPDGYPVVGWAHGTSGLYGNGAPSHWKNLWQHFIAPYPLALQGFVVVAPDYAGLGVDKDAAGSPIVHEYLASPSQANDLFYSIQAAQSAFSELSKKFVVIGHSQGGGVAWAAAQRQAIEPVDGYLGAIAVAPVTSILDLPATNDLKEIMVAAITPGLANIFPKFNPADILSPIATKRFSLDAQIRGGSFVSTVLLSGINLLRPGWMQNEYVQAWQNLTISGGRMIGGPLLVIQGGSDRQISPETTERAVHQTSELFPEARLQYATFPGADHVSTMFASQRLWLEWIVARFAGEEEVKKGCHRSVFESARPSKSYQKVLNWFLEPATQLYQAP